MKQDRDLLAHHGTKLVDLKPQNIVQAAEADMKRRARNAEEATSYAPRYERYAFHRLHVIKAIDAHDLIIRAVQDQELGISSGKFNTRLIYGNGDLLREAAMMTAKR